MVFYAIFQIAVLILLLTDTTSFFTSPLRRFNYLQSSPSSNSMDEISTRYDSLIIDQWGVLHDGKSPYPGVIDILTRLKVAGKQLILLSNSSKRKKNSFKGLMTVGIDAALFDDIITSGDLAWNMITERKFDFNLPKKSEVAQVLSQLSVLDDAIEKLKVFVIGNNQDDLEYITSCNCVLGSPENADFVLARGTFCFMTECNSPGIAKCGVIECDTAEQLVVESDYWLERCLARQLPMLVSNPDFSRPGSGAPMPGIIGKKYSEKGGVVQYVGKPYEAVYDACFDLIATSRLKNSRESDSEISHGGLDKSRGLDESDKSSSLDRSRGLDERRGLDKSRICMIGDSLDHDIKGARDNGIDSIWIANGVHSAEMGVEEGSTLLADEDLMNKMYEKYGVTPTHTIACLGKFHIHAIYL